jgi:membrane protein DedA with SNARE-associated domain/rhodanese-related sulfurtransferase
VKSGADNAIYGVDSLAGLPVQQIAYILEHYGLAAVFLSVLLDQGGLPVPSYPVLLFAGALSLSGGAPVPAVIAAAVVASLLADSAWYFAGARMGRRVLSLLCRFTLSPDTCVRQTEGMFGRVGPWTLLFAKFVPGLGYVSVALSGITRVSLPLFLALDAVGAAIYVSLPVVLGRIFHNAISAVLATLVHLGEYGLLLLAAALALYLALRYVERQLFIRRMRMDRISVDELARMIDEGLNPVIFDVRHADTRSRDGIIPGAVGAHATDILAMLEDYPRDAEIVVYCACPNEASAAVAALHLKRAGFKKIRPLLGGIEAWAGAGRPVVTAAS